MATRRKSILNPMMKHHRRLDGQPMRVQFAIDPNRFKRYTASAGDILLDYSKNRIDAVAMKALINLARECDVEERRDAMWAGEPINVTEGRAVLHMALRYQGNQPVLVNGEDVMPGVRETLANIRVFSDQVRDGTIRGHSGEQFTDIVNIGIGGSYLGPAMVTLALEP